jgi:hypothetical protein
VTAQGSTVRMQPRIHIDLLREGAKWICTIFRSRRYSDGKEWEFGMLELEA